MSVADLVSQRRVHDVMGTTVSLDVRSPVVAEAVIDEVFAQLDDIDARFSTYRPDSEVSRLGRGELKVEECSLELRRGGAASPPRSPTGFPRR